MNKYTPPYHKRLATRLQEKIGACFAAFPLDLKRPILVDAHSRLRWEGFISRGAGAYGADSLWQRATGYAVAPTQQMKPLVIIDLDNLEHPLCRAAQNIVGDTFTVKANGVHLYARLPRAYGNLSYREGKEVMSFRTVGKYVVGAGSHHESAGSYRLVLDVPPVALTPSQADDLIALFGSAPQPEPIPRRPPPMPTYAAHGKPTNPRVIEAIERALEAWEGRQLTYNASGTASLYRNPMRADDAHRSAFFSRVTGMIHDAAGGYWRTATVCDFFGIRYSLLGGLTVGEREYVH